MHDNKDVGGDGPASHSLPRTGQVVSHGGFGARLDEKPNNPADDERFSLTRLLRGKAGSDIAREVRVGLDRTPKELPPKYFYDERGSQLFDAICDTEEYYQTRTEKRLLERVVGPLMERTRPEVVTELGSGAARKTRVLLDELVDRVPEPLYMPVDISAEMLQGSAQALLRDYPELRVHGVVADYERHLHRLPADGCRLLVFLGSTIGNFEPLDAVGFIGAIARGMSHDDHFLLGVDLVKSPEVLHAAYNDARGLTAAFNRNVLHVINRELDGDFVPDEFEHVARYREAEEYIEMLLRARSDQTVRIEALDMTVEFAAGEQMRTEISRKFTRASCEVMLRTAGLEPVGWYVSDDGYFALSLSRRPRG
jgi:L-histidine N-alpha-methyltransferase